MSWVAALRSDPDTAQDAAAYLFGGIVILYGSLTIADGTPRLFGSVIGMAVAGWGVAVLYYTKHQYRTGKEGSQ